MSILDGIISAGPRESATGRKRLIRAAIQSGADLHELTNYAPGMDEPDDGWYSSCAQYR